MGAAMQIKSESTKTIISKLGTSEAGLNLYITTDRSGELLSFIAERDLPVGARVTLPDKPDDPMTVAEFWKKGTQTVPIAAGSALIAFTPQVAKALGASEMAKIMANPLGLPEPVASLSSVTNATDIAIKTAQSPIFRHLAIFSAGFVAALGIQSVWWPDRPWHIALVTATGVGLVVWAIYALIEVLH